MEELNNLENMNFSGSPEYIDVFNDGISTAAEITPTPTVCTGGQATTSCTTCNISIGATACTGTYSCNTCNLSIGTTGACTCAASIIVTGRPQTNYTVYYTCIIKVSSKLGNGVSATVGNTNEGYGHTLKLKYISGNTNSIFEKNKTYDFKCGKIAMTSISHTTAFTYTYSTTTTNPQYTYSGLTCCFNIVNMDGHVFDENTTYTLKNFINVRAIDPDDAPSMITYKNYETISLSAKTYYISYNSADDELNSSAFEKIIKNNIKIGTKFSIYNADKTKTATTINNSAYTYSVGYCTGDNPYNYRPSTRFIINTSAETICVSQERCGESYETTIYLNSSDSDCTLEPMQTNGKLATLKSLYSSTGLGITSFQKMFSGETSSKGDMILTPTKYKTLSITDEVSGTVKYNYTRPTMYYSASTTNANYCLKINDISTFDENMYLVYTGFTSSNITYQGVHPNFNNYKNYPLTNVINNVEWSTSGDEKKHFTFYL